MSNLSVNIAGGEQVVADIFVEVDGSLRDLANAAAAGLSVTTSRCVLLSPAGDRMAHTQTPSDEQLADGDVITVLVGVPRVFAHREGWAFAAVKGDGSVVTWGDETYGGNSDAARSQLTTGVRHFVGSRHAFAAVKEDGSVVAWGDQYCGGNSDAVRSQLSTGVFHIIAVPSPQ